jgi:hypothetical protein
VSGTGHQVIGVRREVRGAVQRVKTIRIAIGLPVSIGNRTRNLPVTHLTAIQTVFLPLSL